MFLLAYIIYHLSLVIYYITYFIVLALFLIFTVIIKYGYIRLKKSKRNILKLEEYLPTEEIRTLKQVFYLVIMTLFIIDIIYLIVSGGNDLIYFLILDVILSLITIAYIKIQDFRYLILTFAMIPFSSLDYMLVSEEYAISMILFIIHLIALAYVAWYFYHKFKKFTKSHGLSYTILLLFNIILISFILTSFVEDVTLLDSLVMVSNAFTSNGYAILDSTIPGKINSIFLVWSGYILSSVGTATLTVALISRYYNKRFDEMERLINELKKK